MPPRRNPERSTRSPEVVRDISDSEDEEDNGAGVDQVRGSPPSSQERGCPTCRDVPTNILRIFPDVFRCPVCMTEDDTHVFVFTPCGHCLCGDCKLRWIPNSIQSPLPDMANLNIANDQGPSSGRRGRPVMSPQARGPDSTRRRKQTIMTAIENWEFNNAIVMDTIFYCDISETFESPDQEPREVFRQRLANAMNTEENGDSGEVNSWVRALHRVSVHFDGDNPLEIVNYTLTMLYGGINLTLTVPLVKGLKRHDVIVSLSESDYDNIEIGAPPTRGECVAYFVSNKLLTLYPIRMKQILMKEQN